MSPSWRAAGDSCATHRPRIAAARQDRQPRAAALVRPKNLVIPVPVPRRSREGLRIGQAVKAGGGALRPVATDKGGINGLRPRVRIPGIGNASSDPKGIDAVVGWLEPRVVAVADRKILFRFVP